MSIISIQLRMQTDSRDCPEAYPYGIPTEYPLPLIVGTLEG